MRSVACEIRGRALRGKMDICSAKDSRVRKGIPLLKKEEDCTGITPREWY